MGRGLEDNNKIKFFLDNCSVGVGFVVVEVRGQMVVILGVVAEGIGMAGGWVGNLHQTSWASFQ